MTRDEFIEKMNALGFGVSSALNIDDELVETVVTAYENDADEVGRTVATVGEKMIGDWSYWPLVLEELLLDDEFKSFMKAVKDYSSTSIKERNHWHMDGI